MKTRDPFLVVYVVKLSKFLKGYTITNKLIPSKRNFHASIVTRDLQKQAICILMKISILDSNHIHAQYVMFHSHNQVHWNVIIELILERSHLLAIIVESLLQTNGIKRNTSWKILASNKCKYYFLLDTNFREEWFFDLQAGGHLRFSPMQQIYMIAQSFGNLWI